MERIEDMDFLDKKLGRTEEQVLNSFKELGCIDIALILDYVDGEYIKISLEDKKIKLSDGFKSINRKELKLLIELFKIWGWLE